MTKVRKLKFGKRGRIKVWRESAPSGHIGDEVVMEWDVYDRGHEFGFLAFGTEDARRLGEALIAVALEGETDL